MVQKLAELRATAQIENAARFVADSQGMTNALKQLGGVAGESASEAAKAEHGFTRYSGALHNLTRKIDPAYRAQSDFHRELTTLTRALDRGQIEIGDYNVRLGQLAQRYDVAADEAQKFGNAFIAAGARADGASRRLSTATSNSRNLGIAFQQAGYQVGDFAVQVASGQGVLRPFIQQGTQLISMFGPWGAVLGAAGAVVGALTTALWNNSDAADVNTNSYGLLLSTVAAYNDEIAKSKDLNREATEQALKKAEALNIQARAELSALENLAARNREEIKALRIAQGEGFNSLLPSISMLPLVDKTELLRTELEGAADAAGSVPEALKRMGKEIGATEQDIAQAFESLSLEAKIAELGGALDTSAGDIARFRSELSGWQTDLDKQIAANDRLIAAWAQGGREAAVVAKTLDIMRRGFAGTEEQARALAERLVDQEEVIKGLTKGYGDLGKASEKERKEVEKRAAAGANYVSGVKQEIELLEKRLAGREAEIPFMEAENRLRETLARDLLPEEQAALKKLIDERERLKRAIDSQSEAERKAAEEAKRAAQEVQRIWDRAGENIQDALADAFVRGKADMASFKDFALNTAAQIVAAMVFRPVIQPIIASAQGGLSMGGPGAVTVGGVPIGGSGGLMGGLSSILNGGLSSSWLTGLGREFATSSLGSALGLSNVGVKGATIISGSGASFAQAFGNLPYAGIGGMLGGLMGLGSGNTLIDMGLSTLGGIGGSMLATSAVGSSIGSALGIGGAALGPIGAVVGGILGTALGGLFGGKPSNNFAMNQIDLATGKIGKSIFDPSERSQATIDASQKMAEVFLETSQAILALTGGTGPAGAFVVAGERDGFQAGIGREGIHLFNAAQYGTSKSFGSAEKAVEWMIGEFTRQITGVTDENIRKAIAYGGDTETLLGNLTFVQQLNALTDDGSMALVNALKALNDQFDEMAQQAKKLGIATTDLERVREREIAATRAQFEAVIMGLQGQANSAAQQYFAQTLDPLTQFRDSVLRQGQLSNMSARDQFLYSQSLFRGIDETTSASDIVSLAQTYLTQARAYGASGDVFTEAFREVNSVVARLIDTREEEKRSFEALGATFSVSIADQTEELKKQFEALTEEVRKLRRAQEKAA